MPLLYSDPRFLDHHTGNHPESPERLRYLYEYLAGRPVLGRFARKEWAPATPAQLALLHEKSYIEEIREFAARGGGQADVDTVVSEQSYEVARLAAGAAIDAVDEVLAGRQRQAACLVRPPGHHALARRAMGFCLFNNVALAAAHAKAQHHLERVLIVDWDVHHGNGTQDLFYADERVWFLSAHRYPFWPGTGAASETGTGAGRGTKFNLPVTFGTPRAVYLDRFESLLEDVAARCRPQLVLVSAGFDAHAADPIGSLGLETEDFEPLTRLVRQVADTHCGGRVVSLLEGGYNVPILAECVECHLDALTREPPG
ncbi:MAG: histone deacetylase [Planctomycetales bacterium]